MTGRTAAWTGRAGPGHQGRNGLRARIPGRGRLCGTEGIGAKRGSEQSSPRWVPRIRDEAKRVVNSRDARDQPSVKCCKAPAFGVGTSGAMDQVEGSDGSGRGKRWIPMFRVLAMELHTIMTAT